MTTASTLPWYQWTLLAAEQIIEKILEDQKRFRLGRRNDDDITLVVIKRVPES